MKSKLTIFRHNFCILLLLCFNLKESAPTFGNEFVHIKVHLPKECSGHEPPVHVYPHTIVHAPVTTPHKVIHHYHYRKRKPAKNNPFEKHAGLLESILLSEVKPTISSAHYKYINQAENIAQHFDSFAERPKPHVETYEVIEETKPNPIEEKFQVIESKVPEQQFHYQDSFDEGYNYEHKPKGHMETFKVIDDLFDDYDKHFKNSDTYTSYLPTKKQPVKSVDSHETDYEQHYSHYGQHGLEEEDNASDDGYHYNDKSQANTIKIVETKTPHQHSNEYSINFGKRPYSETVKIIESKSKPSKHRPQYNPYSYDDHDYHYENSNSGIGIGSSNEEAYSVDHDYKQQSYHNSYRAIPGKHYAQVPEQTYLPPKSTQSDHRHHHNYYKNNVGQNSLYDEQPVPVLDSALDSLNYPYTPLALPQTHLRSQQSSGTSNKATETYNGINSYSAPHVQGVSSNGYQYPSPYH